MIKQCVIKVGARVIEHIARIGIKPPTSFPAAELFRAIALDLAPSSG